MARTTINGIQITDNSITNADVASDAAIAGTKVSPNFGSQVLIVGANALYVNALAEKTGVGTSSPDATLHVAGSVKIVDGNQADGYVLTSDANGLASWAASGGSTPAAGDNNQIQFNASDAFAADANFVWDNTNKRVGIGTSSPVTQLEVVSDNLIYRGTWVTAYTTTNSNSPMFRGRRANGSLAAPSNVVSNDQLAVFQGAGYVNAAFTTGRADMQIIASQNWTDTAQGAYVILRTTAPNTVTQSERVRVSAGGNVGIGTTTPSALLHVNGTATIENNLVVNGASTSLSSLNLSGGAVVGNNVIMLTNTGNISCSSVVTTGVVQGGSGFASGGVGAESGISQNVVIVGNALTYFIRFNGGIAVETGSY